MFLWRYAILAAVFVYNITTAGWYSKEQSWATPCELIYGEPFPDSSVVMPFGCAALILLPKHKRKKLGPRCILVVFLNYRVFLSLGTFLDRNAPRGLKMAI